MGWLVKAKDNRHLLLGWFWIAIAIPTFLFWRESILLVLAMSLYANIESSFTAHHAKKAEDQNGEA